MGKSPSLAEHCEATFGLLGDKIGDKIEFFSELKALPLLCECGTLVKHIPKPRMLLCPTPWDFGSGSNPFHFNFFCLVRGAGKVFFFNIEEVKPL